jgi:CrcB protein
VNDIPLWGWFVAVMAGGLGALLRTALVRGLARHEFPVGVLVANALASAVGAAAVARSASLDLVWIVIIVGGFSGGLSTLSTLAADTVELWMEGLRRVAARNIVVNLAVGLGAAVAAYVIAG